jgi:hypothetical protein
MWLVAGMLFVTAACGAYQFPGGGPSPSPATGTVSGRVVAVPCAPVEPAASTCAGRPVGNLELDYMVRDRVVRQAVTGANGEYAVDLDPGSYTVRIKTYLRVLSGPLNIVVAAGSNLVANYTLDSGIRIPLPQQ